MTKDIGVEILPVITDLSLSPEHTLTIIRYSHPDWNRYVKEVQLSMVISLWAIRRLHSIMLVND